MAAANSGSPTTVPPRVALLHQHLSSRCHPRKRPHACAGRQGTVARQLLADHGANVKILAMERKIRHFARHLVPLRNHRGTAQHRRMAWRPRARWCPLPTDAHRSRAPTAGNPVPRRGQFGIPGVQTPLFRVAGRANGAHGPESAISDVAVRLSWPHECAVRRSRWWGAGEPCSHSNSTNEPCPRKCARTPISPPPAPPRRPMMERRQRSEAALAAARHGCAPRKSVKTARIGCRPGYVRGIAYRTPCNPADWSANMAARTLTAH